MTISTRIPVLSRLHVLTHQALRTTASYLTMLVIFVLAPPVFAASELNGGILIDYYDQTISSINRKLGTAKAHRTALIDQMDVIATRLKSVEIAAEKTTVKNPSQQLTVQRLNTELAATTQSLQTLLDELSHQQSVMEALPVPTIVADALADVKARERHRELAVWQYRIHQTKQNIVELEDKKKQLVVAIDTANSQIEVLQVSTDRLTNQQKSLTDDRRSVEHKFTTLSADIVGLQDRVERLKKRRDFVLENPQDSTNFNNFHGTLPDPTAGTLHKRYSEPKAAGLLKWEGILIKAPLGQEIEAVFDGQVAFAGQIQGLGNVAIIDHGKDFMTLYGMAELLVVEEKQTVVAGQVIGTVGESAAIDASALYFEVRHNAETVNPEEWLSMQLITSNRLE